jgi:hypothetical protein
MNATVQPGIATTVPRIRWGRIAVGAVLIEAILIALTLPMLTLMSNPLVTGTQGAAGDFTGFFATVAAECFVAGALAGWWVARRLSSGFVLHGALTGIVATAIYLGIVSIPPNTIAAAFATYGPFWFFTANGLRIVGCALGAAYRGRSSSHRT